MLNTVQGYCSNTIPFVKNQQKSSNLPVLNHQKSKIVKEELKVMLLKGAMHPVLPCKNQYLSNPFLVSKRDEGKQTSNKFETSEQFYFIPVFPNGWIQSTTKYVPEGRLHVQGRPKRLIISFLFEKGIKKYIRFQWEVTHFEFLCLCFTVGPTHVIFTEHLKVRISLLTLICLWRNW